jgi:ankyrin repeat protein
MKYLFFFLTINFTFSQTNVFDCARTGTAEEMEAFYTSNPELVEALNERGSSPLTLAAYYNNISVANYLIDKVDNINGNSDDGTPLMAAVVKGHVEIAQAFVEAGADPNLTDANGATALHYAVLFNNQELAILLMEAGASAFMKNNAGQSPLDFAKMHNDKTLNTILNK